MSLWKLMSASAILLVFTTAVLAHGGGHGGGGGGSSGGGHSDGGGGEWNPFARKPSETPEEVEADLSVLAEEQEQAIAREAPAIELAKLDRKKKELDLRQRIAVLRRDRDLASQAGDEEQAARLEKDIHAAKARLAGVRKP